MTSIEEAIMIITRAVIETREQCSTYECYEGTLVDKNEHELERSRRRLSQLREIRGLLENLL